MRPVGRRLSLAGAALGVAAGGLAWARRNPSACPYSQRYLLELPHPFVTRGRLVEVLEPRAGEQLLEVGPGTGYYTLDVAERLAPGGTLELLDVQQEMLDHVMARAADRGVENVSPTVGDAAGLPYDDDSFAGAFMVTVLGEVPDQDAALRELRRVIAPGGRAVFGEIAYDPHYVTAGALRTRAETAGLRLERTVGGRLAYIARFAVA